MLPDKSTLKYGPGLLVLTATSLAVTIIMVTASLVLAGDAACLRGNCENGTGTYVFYRYGMWYEGGFQNGLFHGRGTLTMPDGGNKSGFFYKGTYLGPQMENRPEKRHSTGRASPIPQSDPRTQVSTEETGQKPKPPKPSGSSGPSESVIKEDLLKSVNPMKKVNTTGNPKDNLPIN